MRLSEAIRLGSMLKPQGYGQLYAMGKTCAFGAALDAVGHLSDRAFFGSEWSDLFPEMGNAGRWLCPACHSRDVVLHGISCAVVHLNDVHHWTREGIADWLDQILPESEESGAKVSQEIIRETVLTAAEGPTR